MKEKLLQEVRSLEARIAEASPAEAGKLAVRLVRLKERLMRGS